MTHLGGSPGLPVIDVAPLTATALTGGQVSADALAAAERIQAACREHGFFYVTGHAVPATLLAELSEASAEFFALPAEDKLEIAMERGGRAWRGYFPVGGELTSGQPDLKEGLYFGTELPDDDPRVRAGLPLHGRNLFPRQVPRLRELVLSYTGAMTSLGQSVLAGVALSLGLEAGYFAHGYTADPTVLFRIFSYPPSPPDFGGWGVGEHTDYGLLTLLAQDDSGGLQVATPQGWMDAPPVPGTFVCNIGDMLDRLTGGWYRSTPHRVRNVSGRARLSMPFFLDPGFSEEVPPLPGLAAAGDDGRRRWDGQDLRAFTGTYGDYLLGKVSKVFPQLRQDVLLPGPGQRSRGGWVTMRTMALAADSGRDDDAARSELACYDIGTVLSLDRLPSGHPAVRKVTTSAGTYLLKPGWRHADVALLAQLPALSRYGIRQPEVIRTGAGDLTSPNGYFLLEFLAGEPELDPSDTQLRAVMRAAGHLHVALSRLPAGYEPDRDSLFVQVTDIAFLIAELPGLVRHYGLATRPADTAIAWLAEHQAALDRLPRQLVHGDIGPDNVLLDGDQVVAIIDFTPHVLPVLFAASTALYWYHVYGQPAISADGLAASRAAMGEVRPWAAGEEELWVAGLAWEGLRRLATTLELARRGCADPGPAARARMAALEAITTRTPGRSG